MPKSSWIRWLIRLAWLAALVIGYRSLVDVGAPGSGSYGVHMIVMFAIYATGDLVLERWNARAAARRPGS